MSKAIAEKLHTLKAKVAQVIANREVGTQQDNEQGELWHEVHDTLHESATALEKHAAEKHGESDAEKRTAEAKKKAAKAKAAAAKHPDEEHFEREIAKRMGPAAAPADERTVSGASEPGHRA